MTESTTIKTQSVYKPKRKPNLVRWMSKHRVGANVVSLNVGVSRAVEKQHLNDIYYGK